MEKVAKRFAPDNPFIYLFIINDVSSVRPYHYLYA